jgi:hypothetical protein
VAFYESLESNLDIDSLLAHRELSVCAARFASGRNTERRGNGGFRRCGRTSTM